MNFGKALEALKNGKRVAREGWNGKGMWIAINEVDPIMNPYIYMSCVDGSLVPWLASQTDVLAEDWGVKED